MESKTLKYLQKIDGSDEVIAMITSIRVDEGQPVVVKGFDREVQKSDQVKVQGYQQIILPAVPQQLIVSLIVVP